MPAAILRFFIVAVFPFFTSFTPLLPSGDIKDSIFQPSVSHFGLDASTSMKVAPRAFCLVTIGKFAVFGISGTTSGAGGGVGAVAATGGGVVIVGAGAGVGGSKVRAGRIGFTGVCAGVFGGCSFDPGVGDAAAAGGDAGGEVGPFSEPFHWFNEYVPSARAVAVATLNPIFLTCFCTKPLGSGVGSTPMGVFVIDGPAVGVNPGGFQAGFDVGV